MGCLQRLRYRALMTEPSIRDFHAHIYYDAEEVEQAKQLAAAAQARFPLAVGHFHLGLFGTAHLALDLRIPDRPDGGRGSPVVAPFDGRIVRSSDGAGGPFGIWLESEKLNLSIFS